MTRLSRVVPKKKECLLGGPITKPMDLAITLCPFLLIFDPVLHWPIWPTLTGKQRRGRQSKPPRYKSYYCYPRYRPLIQPSKRLHASIFYLMKWKPEKENLFNFLSQAEKVVTNLTTVNVVLWLMQCDSNVTKVTKSSYEVPNVIIVTNCSFDVTKRKESFARVFPD